MTWRAFIIGLLGVAAFSLLDPYTSFIKSYGWLTASCFPASAVVVLVAVGVGLNVLIKLVRRSWALSRAELMLVWCMMIVGAVIPCEGIGRYWYSLIAGPPYMARRTDLYWEDDGSLAHVPADLVLSKDPKSVAAKQYFEGTPEGGRVPWGVWIRPLLAWSVFLMVLYMAVFFLCGIIRRQWVDVERLMFPLARVPLEFTEGSAGGGLLPSAFTNKAFVVGVICSAAFRLLRALPLFFGKDAGIPLALPIGDVFMETPLQFADFHNFEVWPSAIGFAYLVPADVSLSVWFFFLFSRAELYVAHELAIPRAWNTWSPFMSWQQVGAYASFVVAMVWLARKHLWAVTRKALGLAAGPDDAGEPIGYRLAFWGFWAAIGGCVTWHMHYGMRLWTTLFVLAMLFSSLFVYARIVAQGGLYVSRTFWVLPNIVHGVSLGRAFTPPGAVIAQMHSALLIRGATNMLAPMAIHAFRISEVFEPRRRRYLLPALVLAIIVAMPLSTYTVLRQAYARGGAMNFSDTWSVRDVPKEAFDGADRMIKQPAQSAEPYWEAMGFGAALTAAVVVLRARFYWWPIHPIGFLACNSWHAHRLWFPFLLGWLTKIGIMKFSGGRMLRDARYFFIALIMVEAFTDGISALVRTISGGAVPGF